MNSALHNLENMKYNNLKYGTLKKTRINTSVYMWFYFVSFFIYDLGHTYTINLKSFSELKDMEVSDWFRQKMAFFPPFLFPVSVISWS